MHRVVETLEAILSEGRIPSASIVVRVDGEDRLVGTWGAARLEPRRRAASDQTYDLASVTKVLAGTTVAATLIAEGALGLDEPVARHLAGVDPRITIRHLLQHTSGLPAWEPLYGRVVGGWGTAEARRTILDAARIAPTTEPGTIERYSDLGFLLLLDVLEHIGDAPLDVLFHQCVLEPLGIADLRFGWPGAAATELCPVRGFVVEGTVHDLNCAAMGGVSTHAGLFGTARAVKPRRRKRGRGPARRRGSSTARAGRTGRGRSPARGRSAAGS